ncbi:unannotated protein [freshwater metagenome]|uniref:Unannotated protein n=1 Tax=freshwater metagenome TaxID=449393 RepID=A0A6J6WZ25_9ZZZZ
MPLVQLIVPCNASLYVTEMEQIPFRLVQGLGPLPTAIEKFDRALVYERSVPCMLTTPTMYLPLSPETRV